MWRKADGMIFFFSVALSCTLHSEITYKKMYLIYCSKMTLPDRQDFLRLQLDTKISKTAMCSFHSMYKLSAEDPRVLICSASLQSTEHCFVCNYLPSLHNSPAMSVKALIRFNIITDSWKIIFPPTSDVHEQSNPCYFEPWGTYRNHIPFTLVSYFSFWHCNYSTPAHLGLHRRRANSAFLCSSVLWNE